MATRPARSCPVGKGGKHSLAYYYGGICEWCGDRAPRRYW